jgi:plastocyanin
MRLRVNVGIAIALLLFGVTAAACGSGEEADPTPVQTWKITPASGGDVSPTAPPATTATAPAATAANGDGGAVTTLELVGVNNAFEPEELEAPAGRITIEFDNKDGGVVHNVHVFTGDSSDGEDVGETELQPGPEQQTLELELEAGEYYYVCDAHPTTMEGSLEVE